MILVTTGTNGPPFDRLLSELDGIGKDEDLVVQHGPSAIRPPGATCFEYVSFPRLVELVREARLVVTHAGVGTILVSLMNGKRPLVVPRRERFKEAVDDHQLELSRRLESQGLVVLVEDPADLLRVVGSTRPEVEHWSPGNQPLVADLRDYLRGAAQGNSR
jgi:UDP-N-acetylglucosamine transferase subunit ALG13